MSEQPEWKGNSLHHVSVQASPIILYKDLKKKIAEIRVKRDAIMLAHNTVNLDQDKYNTIRSQQYSIAGACIKYNCYVKGGKFKKCEFKDG